MTALLILMVIQLVATLGAIGFAWRKFAELKREIEHLRDVVEAAAPARRARQAAQAELFATVAAAAPPPAAARPPKAQASDATFDAAPAVTPRREKAPPRLIPIDDAETPASWRDANNWQPTPDHLGLAAAVAIAAPALGLAFSVPVLALALAGMGLAIAAVLLSLRFDWKAPAWAGAIGAGAWAFAALETGAATHDAALFAGALELVAAIGLTQAALRRRAWSGAAMAMLMAAAALVLASATSFISPQGLAYGAIVAAAAGLGASRLRRDGLHLAAFAAAGIGLAVHSGQHDAAIWFTPLAAWTGAIFFGIAAVRVPALGSRGALLAATGTTAALFAAGSLALSQQGLADPLPASGAFAGLALLFAGVLALAARRAGSIGALALTAWILVAAIALAASAAFSIALASPVGATAFAGLSLAFVGADLRWPDKVWRFFATIAALASFAVALLALHLIGASAELFGPYGQAGFALALPAALIGFAAFAARRAPHTSGALEIVAIALALLLGATVTRVIFSAGAPALQPISFVEGAVHVTLWLAAALLLAVRSNHGAGDVRRAYVLLLAAAALVSSLAGALLWFTSYWTARPETELAWAPLNHAPLGFALPAILAWAHWAYWRYRRTPIRARVALGAAGFLTAAFATFEIALRRGPEAAGSVDWVILGSGAFAFAIAIGLLFAPGVTLNPIDRQLDLEEYLKRQR